MSAFSNAYLNQFQSRDPFPGQNKLPQSQNGYSYVNNNPVNYTDPSGLCAEFGDDGCWSIYDQIIALCPECSNIKRPWIGGYRYLHEENIYYLQPILEDVRNGWRPEFVELDAISLAIALDIGITSAIPGVVLAEPVSGLELLYNLHTGTKTYFLVVGGEAGVGLGESLSITKSWVYNIGEDNLQYSGAFNAINGTAAAGLGFGGGFSWVPGDFLDKDQPYSVSASLNVGCEASLTINHTEYIPLYSINNVTGEYIPHTWDYLSDPDVAGETGWLTYPLSSAIRALDQALETTPK